MSIRITADAMTSNSTRHTATRVDAVLDAWTVSWLGDETTVDRLQAEAAITLAELAAEGVTPVEPAWRLAVSSAHLLGVATHWAVARIKTAAVPS